MIRFIKALTLGLALIASQQFAMAQRPTPVNPAAPKNSPAVVFQGKEDLGGTIGNLTFYVQNGTVRMVDRTNQSVYGKTAIIDGKWVYAFANCVYVGTVDQNNIVSGVARFTSGPNTGVTWNFAVAILPPQ